MIRKNKRHTKIRFSTAFILIVCFGILTFTAVVYFIFSASLSNFQTAAEEVNRKVILDNSKLMLKNNSFRIKQYYGAINNNLKTAAGLISLATGKIYMNCLNSEGKKKKNKLVYKTTDDGIYYNTSFKRKGVVCFNEHSSEIRRSPNQLGTDIFFGLEQKVHTIWENTESPYMNDMLIILKIDGQFFLYIYPDTLNMYDFTDADQTEIISRVKTYYEQLSPKKNPKRTVKWSEVRKSVKEDDRLFSLMTPIYSENGEYLGVSGITLILDMALVSLLHPDSNEEKMHTRKDSNYNLDSFEFILSNSGGVIALPQKYANLFSLPLFTSHKDSYYKGSLYDSKDKNILSAARKIIKEKDGVINLQIKGRNYLFAFSKLSSVWTLVGVVPESNLLVSLEKSRESISDINDSIRQDVLIITFIILLLSVFLCLYFFESYVISPIIDLCKKTLEMGKGNFDQDFDYQGIFEIETLYKTHKALAMELKEYTDNMKREIEARKRYESEIRLAGQMQMSLLPEVDSKFVNSKFDFYADISFAKDASGDFYDFYKLDKDRVAILTADVCGKGIPAAFFMAVSKAVIRSICYKAKDDPGKALTIINRLLNKDNGNLMFVTLFLVYYNTATGEFKYANAGHHQALKVSDGKCKEFGLLKGMVLAFYPDTVYKSKSITLKKGEKIIMYTDGLTEAVNSNEEEYSLKRLTDLIESNNELTCREMTDVIIRDVRNFEEGKTFDDATISIIERLN